MKELTLRQVCREVGVTRRAVQGYEKRGLVKPSGKTKRGYLLYNDEAQERIRYLRRMQEYGYSLKEIVEFEKKETHEQLVSLTQKRNVLADYLCKMRSVLAELDEKIDHIRKRS